MKWMECDLQFNDEQFTIMGPELCIKGEMVNLLASPNMQAKIILQ